MTDKNLLKTWFENGKKPTQEQFWAWMDSYFHKSELLEISNISDLERILNEKAEIAALDALSLLLDDKVDKKDGYQLSQEDFTTFLKEKLENLQDYSETIENIQERIDGVLIAPNNLGDVDDVVEARSNLGLGTVAIYDVGKGPDQVPTNAFISNSNSYKLWPNESLDDFTAVEEGFYKLSQVKDFPKGAGIEIPSGDIFIRVADNGSDTIMYYQTLYALTNHLSIEASPFIRYSRKYRDSPDITIHGSWQKSAVHLDGKIRNVETPTQDLEAANKEYVDINRAPMYLDGSSIVDRRTSGHSIEHSNMFGEDAGKDVDSISFSNFFGNMAGMNTSGGWGMNFFGFSSGINTTDVGSSNFIGTFAGELSVSVYFSNFFGFGAGAESTDGNSSNFFGQNTGSKSLNVSYSNLFGHYAGHSSENNVSVNFFGREAGGYSRQNSESNFFGPFSGIHTENLERSNLFGAYTGQHLKNAPYSIFLGFNVGKAIEITEGVYEGVGPNNIIIGTEISLPAGIEDSINIGGVLFGINTHKFIDEKYPGENPPSIVPEEDGKIGIGVIPTVSTLEIAGDVRITEMGSGLIMQSENGKWWRYTPDNDGFLKSVEVTNEII